MSGKKRRFENFNLYDYQGVEAHLSRMAEKGWRLEKTGNTLWTYRQAEPAKVQYAVTYTHRASQFDPIPSEEQEALSDLCQAAGWAFVCDWNQMQIFAAEDPDPVPLETDEALRLEVIHRTMKKHFFPGNLILLALALVMVASSICTAVRRPLRYFSSNSSMFTTLMFTIIVFLVLFSLGSYLSWYRRSEKSIAAGGTCVPLRSGYRKGSLAALIAVLFLSAGYAFLEISSGRAGYALFFLCYTSLLFLLIVLVQGTKNLLKHCGVSRGKNMAVTLAVDILLALLLVGGLSFAAFRFDWFSGEQHDTYLYQNESWDTNPVPFHLTISDITGEKFEHIRRDEYPHGSILLNIHEYRERVLRESDGQRLNLIYEIREPKTQWLYDLTLKSLLTEKRDRMNDAWIVTNVWKEEDLSDWQADSVYQRYMNGTPVNEWVLCWPGRMVKIIPDEEFSPEEMSRIGRKLHP